MFNVIILGIVSFLTDVSTEMVYPLLPLYLNAMLGAQAPAFVGIIEGFAESIASLLKVFSGYFSDKFQQRKPLAIAGYSFSTIGKVFLYLSTSWSLVFVGRVADRFGKGVRTAPRDALIADSTPAEKRGNAYGLHRAFDSAGASLGVIFAFVLFVTMKDGFSSIFLISLIPAALAVVFLFLVK
jgi:sugar phosphate permease